MKEEVLVPFVGAVVVALIAGLVSLVVAILAKDQKTSEFRQAWIDALRNDVSELVGHLQAILDIAVDLAVDEDDENAANRLYHEKHAEFMRMEVHIVRIKLRLNPDEHQGVLRILDKIHSDEGSDDPKEMVAQLKKLVDEVQPILKGEWVRVKKGELSYRLLKWGSMACIIVAGTLAFFYYGLDSLAPILRQFFVI